MNKTPPIIIFWWEPTFTSIRKIKHYWFSGTPVLYCLHWFWRKMSVSKQKCNRCINLMILLVSLKTTVQFLSIHNTKIPGMYWEKFQWQIWWELHRWVTANSFLCSLLYWLMYCKNQLWGDGAVRDSSHFNNILTVVWLEFCWGNGAYRVSWEKLICREKLSSLHSCAQLQHLKFMFIHTRLCNAVELQWE